MKKKIFFGLGGLAILIFLGLTFAFPKKVEHGMKNPEKTITVTKTDSSREIAANSGDVIQVELEGAGATGYWWYIDNLDGEYFELISEDTRANPGQDNAGAPVTGIWKFKTLKTGKTSIKMDYYRSWEGKESAAGHFSVNFSIN